MRGLGYDPPFVRVRNCTQIVSQEAIIPRPAAVLQQPVALRLLRRGGARPS
jgi:hypothetical protein